MLIDRFGRRINYLRVSVTDRCNLACSYCVPRKDFVKLAHESILSLEEIEEIVKEAVALGITKLRITGGEPLVRRNVESLIARIASMEGIEDLGLTTNGTILDRFAEKLASAGLKRVNISLDVLDPVLYGEITGGGDVNTVLKGIESAKAAGLGPLKINCIILPSVPEEERDKIRRFCDDSGLDLQFIAYMNLEDGSGPVEKTPRAHRPPLCSSCNKIRLTADGKLFPCLFSPRAVVVREEPSARDAILKAVGLKDEKGYSFPHESMSRIGG